MRIKQLKQAKADTFNEMKAVREKLAATDLKDEDRTKLKAEFAALETKYDAIVEDLAAEERMADRERTLTPVTDANDAAASRVTATVRDRSEDDPMRGFRNMADFALSVRNACAPAGRLDPRLAAMGRVSIGAAPTGYMQESNGAAGEGYEVPAQMRQTLFELAFPEEDLLSRVNPEPTMTNATDIDADETTPWGSSGVQAYWRGQGNQLTGSKLGTKKRTVRLHELYAFVLAEEELLADAPRLNDRLTNKSSLAIRYKAHEALINGNGVGQPLGWRNANGPVVTVSKESGQAADTINATNVLKMYSRLLSGGAPFWLANRDTLPQIATMTIGNQPIWTPPIAGLTDAPNGTLLGLPIIWSEHAETVGDLGDIQLVNPIGYYAAVKAGAGNGIKFDTSIHLYFDYAIEAFRWIFRMGGQPFLSAAVSAAKGSNSKSHFIQLEAR